jgi:hypothetical protein
VSGGVAGKVTCLFTDENYDLIVMASSQGSILMLSIRKLPWSKDLPERPPSPRGFLPVDELSLVDVLLVDKEQLQEKKKHAQVPFFNAEGRVGSVHLC